jgi:hypothetical protein
MWAYKVAFEVPDHRRAKLRGKLRIDEPIIIDRRLGLGVPPSQRLQRRLRHPPQLTALDRTLTAVYLVWGIEPHLALAYLLWRHPTRFRRAALRLAAAFDATLIGWFATPTAPPWWASEIEGRMNEQVRRVTAEVIRSGRGEQRPGSSDDHVADANPWAAWHSDHFGSAL